jgi:hypothetical protein
MTRIELIRGIGDTLTRLDVLRGGLLPRDPQRVALDDLRLLLDDRQRRLSQQLFDETTEAYRRATWMSLGSMAISSRQSTSSNCWRRRFRTCGVFCGG